MALGLVGFSCELSRRKNTQKLSAYLITPCSGLRPDFPQKLIQPNLMLELYAILRKKRNHGVGMRIRTNTFIRAFPRKLAYTHAISHSLKAFDSPFSLTVPHRFFHARACRASFSSYSILAKCMGRNTRGIGVFVRFRELSSFRNTKTHGIRAFPQKMAYTHASMP